MFIPLLLMGGIVGRLFREFAMTVSIAVVMSAIISLTLTPMMCSRFLKHHTGEHGRLYRVVEGMFDALIGGYRRTLDVALRFRFVTLLVFLGTLCVTVYLFIDPAQGVLPAAGHGRDLRAPPRARRTSRSPRWRSGSRRWPRSSATTRTWRRSRRRSAPGSAARPATTARSSSASSPGTSGLQRVADHRAAGREGAGGRGRAAVHAGGAGHQHRRPAVQDAVSVHAAGRRRRAS